jgi:hypothetical protein
VRIALRPTVAADLPFCIGEPLPHRIRCITALAGDRVIGLGGIGFRPDGAVIAFAQINDEARRYPAAIHRAGRAVMAMIAQSGVAEVWAEAGNAAAARWLIRLGFARATLCGREAFVWRRASDGRH